MRRFIQSFIVVGVSIASSSFTTAPAEPAPASHAAPIGHAVPIGPAAPARQAAPVDHAAPVDDPHTAPAHGKATSTAPTPDEALARLVEGNRRFATGESTFDRLDEARRCQTYIDGQAPIAAVLSCADSRVPVELLFDQGIGDLFVIRVAGNVADTDEIGTIEYGVGHLNIPLIVVIGHSKCGAVTAVVEGAKPGGSLPGLLDNIIPAVELARSENPRASRSKLVNAAIRANVFQAMVDLLTTSQDVRDAVRSGRVKLVGGMYDLHNGTIKILGPHPAEAQLLDKTFNPRELLVPLTHAAPDHAAPETHAAPDPHEKPDAHAVSDAHATPAKVAHVSVVHADATEGPSKAKHAETKHGHDAHAGTSPDAHATDKHAADEHATDEHATDEHATTQPTQAGASNNWMMLVLCLGVSSAGSAAVIGLMSRRAKTPEKQA